MHSGKGEFCSTKLTYRSMDPVHGIDLEFLKTEEHLNTYLNVHSIPLSPHKGNPQSAPFILEIEGKIFRSTVYRLSGGQRFLLPSELAEKIICALKNHKEVKMTLASYKTLLRPEDFSSKFEKLLHPWHVQNPFHLPF